MTPTDTLDLFSWQLPPAAPAGVDALPKGVVFGLPEVTEDQAMPIWRIDLPADDELAARQIGQALEMALARQSRLEELPAQLNKLAIQASAAGASAKDASVAGASFAVLEAEDPEAELLTALAQISSTPAKGAISFGLAERLGEGWEQVNKQFQAFADRLQRTLAHLAWVETRQEGRLIGQTVVGWSGDCDTVWGAAVTPEQMGLHRRSLETALQSRITMLHTFTTAVQGAVKLSVLLSTPGGVILALPTVWKYVNQVLAVL
jgi:hypothetical protein